MVFLPIANRRISDTRRRRQRGTTALEFGLVLVAAVPLLFGMIGVGIILGRSIQAVQVTRDVGHMYGLGVDFTAGGVQNVVNKLAQGFDMSATGNAVLILSQVATVYQADCTAAGVPANQCNNLGQPVFTQRIVLGNPTLRASAFGTPPAQYIGSQGNISPTDYYQQNGLVAGGFAPVLPQNDGDTAWLVEGFFTQPDLTFLVPGFQHANRGTYVRAIF